MSTHTLYLLRHAKSSWDDPTLPDADRPLAPRGLRDARRMAKHLRRAEARPDLVLCSSSARTRETLALVQTSLKGARIELEDGLYAATADELLERLRDVPDGVSSVLVIGHNPGLQDLAHTLTPESDNDRLGAKFVTCALATLGVPRWSELGAEAAELRDYVTPKELRRA